MCDSPLTAFADIESFGMGWRATTFGRFRPSAPNAAAVMPAIAATVGKSICPSKSDWSFNLTRSSLSPDTFIDRRSLKGRVANQSPSRRVWDYESRDRHE